MGNDWFHEYFIDELKAIGRKPTSNMQHEVVDSLPSSGNEQTIYFVKSDSGSSNNHYDEYVWISSSSTFEKIGSTQIDGSTTQPDWNQNDATQPDYVKNRPFYTGDPAETVLVEETTLPFEEGNGGLYVGLFETTFLPIVGETYKISWDGSIYESTYVEFYEFLGIGNLSIVGEGSDTGEPFLFIQENSKGFGICTVDTSASHTISISRTATPVVKIDPKYLDQPDWDQNDVTASSYIKNRPFYTGYTEEKTLVKEGPVNFKESSGHYLGTLRPTFSPIVGETYKVSWDGTVYESVCIELREFPVIGNLSIVGEGSDTGEPFVMSIRNGREIRISTLDTASSHVISISGRTIQVIKIEEKYLPDTVATKSDVEVVQTTADNAQTTASNAQTTASNAQTTADNAQTTANNARTTANNAQTTANAAKSTASNAQTTADNAQTTANAAKKIADKALTINSYGVISAPIGPMTQRLHQSLLLTSADSDNQVKFEVDNIVGLKIIVNRDGGMSAPVSNPSTVEFGANAGAYMQLSGINALIMRPIGSNKKFKITVDDTGTLTTTEVT